MNPDAISNSDLARRAAFWLARNARSIDPAVTHLAALVPLAASIARDLELRLPSKRDEPLFAARAPQVQTLIAEIESRVARGELTYQFMNALPYRIGFLMIMRDSSHPDLVRLRQAREPESTFDPLAYATHAGFMRMLELSDAARLSQARPWFWLDVARSLRGFPGKRTLPVTGVMDTFDMNWMIAYDVWPVGYTLTTVEADGKSFGELGFPMHDARHRKDVQDPPFYHAQIISSDLRETDRVILQSFSRRYGRTDPLFQLLHLLHGGLFHESDVFYRLEGAYAERSRPALRHGLLEGFDGLVQRLKAPLPTDREGLVLRASMLSVARASLAARGQPDGAPESALDEAAAIYRGYLDAATRAPRR